MKKTILYISVLMFLICSCSVDSGETVPSGTLRIVGIGASGSMVSISNPIDFAENDVYYAMKAFGTVGSRAGYSEIKYYEYFPEQTLNSGNHGFENQYNDYSSLMTSLTDETFSADDLTVVLISSHGGYDGTVIDCGSTYALENGHIMTVDKSDGKTIKTSLMFSKLNEDLEQLNGTVLALVQVCYAGGNIVGDSVIANTDVYPEASVVENLFNTDEQPISDHVFYLCSCPYYSESVGVLGDFSYFFKAVLKGLGMNMGSRQMEVSVPASVNGQITLSGLTRYVTNNGGIYNGNLGNDYIDQYPVVSGGSSDLLIFNLN